MNTRCHTEICVCVKRHVDKPRTGFLQDNDGQGAYWAVRLRHAFRKRVFNRPYISGNCAQRIKHEGTLAEHWASQPFIQTDLVYFLKLSALMPVAGSALRRPWRVSCIERMNTPSVIPFQYLPLLCPTSTEGMPKNHKTSPRLRAWTTIVSDIEKHRYLLSSQETWSQMLAKPQRFPETDLASPGDHHSGACWRSHSFDILLLLKSDLIQAHAPCLGGCPSALV